MTRCDKVLASSSSISRSSGPDWPATGRTTTSSVARSGRSRVRRTSPGPHTAAITIVPSWLKRAVPSALLRAPGSAASARSWFGNR